MKKKLTFLIEKIKSKNDINKINLVFLKFNKQKIYKAKLSKNNNIFKAFDFLKKLKMIFVKHILKIKQKIYKLKSAIY